MESEQADLLRSLDSHTRSRVAVPRSKWRAGANSGHKLSVSSAFSDHAIRGRSSIHRIAAQSAQVLVSPLSCSRLSLSLGKALPRNGVTFGRNRTSFKWRQLGAIAITVAFKTCRVVALVFGDSQCARFQSSQFGVVAGFAAVPTIREVTLSLCPNQRNSFRSGKFRMITGFQAAPTIRNGACMVRDGHFGQLRSGQLGAITGLPTVLAHQ
jgi:hypothetical protein